MLTHGVPRPQVSAAGYLKSRVRPGDRVGVALGNRAEYFIALFAIIANRAIVVSINPQAKEHDAGHVLADSAPVCSCRAREPGASPGWPRACRVCRS